MGQDGIKYRVEFLKIIGLEELIVLISNFVFLIYLMNKINVSFNNNLFEIFRDEKKLKCWLCNLKLKI